MHSTALIIITYKIYNRNYYKRCFNNNKLFIVGRKLHFATAVITLRIQLLLGTNIRRRKRKGKRKTTALLAFFLLRVLMKICFFSLKIHSLMNEHVFTSGATGVVKKESGFVSTCVQAKHKIDFFSDEMDKKIVCSRLLPLLGTKKCHRFYTKCVATSA